MPLSRPQKKLVKDFVAEVRSRDHSSTSEINQLRISAIQAMLDYCELSRLDPYPREQDLFFLVKADWDAEEAARLYKEYHRLSYTWETGTTPDIPLEI